MVLRTGMEVCALGNGRFAPGTVCCASRGKRKSPQNFRSAGFINPGGYLLSRDLSSDYHRRSNVSLPGSEWDRVGPLGYDHQVSA